MTTENLIAIILALIPAYFGWRQFEKKYLLDRKATDVDLNSSTSQEWQKLYITAREEGEQTKQQFKELKEEFYEMRTDNQQLRIEFNSFKRSMQNEKKRLENEIILLSEENTRLLNENIILTEDKNLLIDENVRLKSRIVFDNTQDGHV